MISISDIKGISKKGIRENNEDYIIYSTDSIIPTQTRVMVLCDGMGGHGHGEVASQIIAENVFSYLVNLSKDISAGDLQCALDNALITLNNADTYSDDRKMGTTLVVAVINQDDVLVGHVGDSRCYLFDENSVRKFRTKDHSKVAEAVEAEILTEEEAYNSHYKNILTRSVMSGNTDVKIEVDRLKVNDKDRLLICTDGVVDALRDDELAAILVNRNIDEALGMIDSECKIKSHDNYSVIIADLHKEQNKNFSNKTKMLRHEILDAPSTTLIESSHDKEQLHAEVVYWKTKCQAKKYRQCLLWGAAGFSFAFLLCVGVAFFAFERLNKTAKENEFFWKTYKSRTSEMIKSFCWQTNDRDSVILKKELLYQYEKIESKYFPQKRK